MFKLVRYNVTLRTAQSMYLNLCVAHQSHYETLHLRKNCTDKEIKEAYIKLSKKYHPDKNKDVNAQQDFVRVVEAYNVLSKPSSRARYDNTIEIKYRPKNIYETPGYRKYNQGSFYQDARHQYEYEWPKRQQKQQQQHAKGANSSYYGGLGVNRIPNYILILLCFGIALVGSILQIFVIREMYVVQKRQAIAKSQHLADELDKVRQAAQERTNEMQTRLILEKIVGSASPTIATASLGTALATAASDKE